MENNLLRKFDINKFDYIDFFGFFRNILYNY